MDNPSPLLPGPGDRAISDGRSPAGASEYSSGVASFAGALISAGGVGLFCLSLFLPWWAYVPGWEVLVGTPLVLIFFPAPFVALVDGAMGVFTLVLEVLTFYIFVICVIALFKSGTSKPKWWHFSILLLVTLYLVSAQWLSIQGQNGFTRFQIGYWVALGSLLVVLLGVVWQKVQIARRT